MNKPTTRPDPAAHPHPAVDHAHPEVPLETAFDFLNTLELDDGALVERLPAIDAAADWLVKAGVIADRKAVLAVAPSETERANVLARIVETRTALRDVAHAVAHDRVPNRAAVDAVNRALRSRQRVELVMTGDDLRLGHSHVGDAVDDALARIAEPIVREIGAGHEDRVRICANDTCRWVFYDESRSGRRRWCDMATCGNRAKARRHRARRKSDLAETTAETGAATGAQRAPTRPAPA